MIVKSGKFRDLVLGTPHSLLLFSMQLVDDRVCFVISTDQYLSDGERQFTFCAEETLRQIPGTILQLTFQSSSGGKLTVTERQLKSTGVSMHPKTTLWYLGCESKKNPR